MKKLLFLAVLLSISISACKSGVSQVATSAAPNEGGYVCHLECSNTETSAEGATEEEARENVKKFIKEKCNPEDGQYFIVCNKKK